MHKQGSPGTRLSRLSSCERCFDARTELCERKSRYHRALDPTHGRVYRVTCLVAADGSPRVELAYIEVSADPFVLTADNNSSSTSVAPSDRSGSRFGLMPIWSTFSCPLLISPFQEKPIINLHLETLCTETLQLAARHKDLDGARPKVRCSPLQWTCIAPSASQAPFRSYGLAVSPARLSSRFDCQIDCRTRVDRAKMPPTQGPVAPPVWPHSWPFFLKAVPGRQGHALHAPPLLPAAPRTLNAAQTLKLSLLDLRPHSACDHRNPPSQPHHDYLRRRIMASRTVTVRASAMLS